MLTLMLSILCTPDIIYHIANTIHSIVFVDIIPNYHHIHTHTHCIGGFTTFRNSFTKRILAHVAKLSFARSLVKRS